MTRLDRIHELFDAALDRPPTDRPAFLAQACATDDALRHEVESLLAAESTIGDDFLRPSDVERPPPAVGGEWPSAAVDGGQSHPAGNDPPPPDLSDSLLGRHVGRFRIKSIIARGGMGTVYEAVQDAPHRVVALKVMHDGLPSRSALRRFAFESQVLARLRHPNIAQVIEAGTHRLESGPTVTYFAMEYIPGARPITEHFNRHETPVVQSSALPSEPDAPARYVASGVPAGRPAVASAPRGGRPSRPPASPADLRARLDLFARVCDAVHHGHQKGVIHRDLKPANILVDSAGVPKVIDFGVARATDSDLVLATQQTDIGQLIGTMQYMSPEQCDADPHDLDTRSDVYSLGVVLYELLSGALPYDAATTTIYQATRVIKESIPPRPSTLGRDDSFSPRSPFPVPRSLLRGDLDTIVLKALEKDREKRYASAAELAADVRRHLNREPIAARSPGAWARALRWAGRRPLVTTTLLCACVAVFTMTGTITSIQYLRARPLAVELSKDQRYARLYSVVGEPLVTWDGWEPYTITLAKFVPRTDKQHGGDLVVIGFDRGPRADYARAFCVFDFARSATEPARMKRLSPDEVPSVVGQQDMSADLPARKSFAPHRATIADVFLETGDPEIVVTFANPYSQRAIRIYDLELNLLYENWHDGEVSEAVWLKEPGLLVFAGDNGQRHLGDHKPVVFVVRPVQGVRESQLRAYRYFFLEFDGREAGAPGVKVRPASEADRSRHFHLALVFSGPDEASIGFDVDQDGIFVGATPNDEYRQRQCLLPGSARKLPDPLSFRLVPR